MYNKLERLKSMIEDVEMEDRDRNRLIDYIDDLQRDLEIEADTYNYLNDEDNYE